MTPHDTAFDHKVSFIVGFLGSLTIASITGVGIDMMIYMVLVLWCHADLKIAIPTSVVLMAFTSNVPSRLPSGTSKADLPQNIKTWNIKTLKPRGMMKICPGILWVRIINIFEV
jgi:hypothetical protein